MTIRNWFQKFLVNRRLTGRSNSRTRLDSRTAALEQLENRSLLTTATWTSGTSTLAVVGDTAADTLVITKDGSTGNVKVTDGGVDVTITNGPVTPASVAAITIDGQSNPDSTLGGPDSIDLFNVNTGNSFSGSLNGNVTIRGGYFNDTISGSEFADSIMGGNGSDYLYGNDGNDTIDGGDGSDYTVHGGNGDDSILGGEGDDGLVGGGHNDTLDGGSGNDGLLGDNGLMGTEGNDSLLGGPGSNTLTGSLGNDSLSGGADNDVYFFGRSSGAENLGSDTLTENSGEGVDVLELSSFLDPIEINLGTTSSQTIEASELTISLNNDSTFENVRGSAGADDIDGNSQANFLEGYTGNDTIDGHAGNDTLDGAAGDDSLTGGAGDDTYAFPRWSSSLNLGSDTLHESSGAGTGTDHLDFTSFIDPVEVNLGTTSSQTIETSELTISLSSASTFENATGGAGADSLTGSDSVENYLTGLGGADTLVGGSGNDTLDPGIGNDSLAGGDGNDTYKFTGSGSLGDDIVNSNAVGDTVDFSGVGGTVNISLLSTSAQTVHSGWSWTVQLVSFADIRSLVGSGYDDTVTGTDSPDLIYGGAGADSIAGNESQDTIYGEAGNDSLDGGIGLDVLYGGDGNDTIDGGEGGYDDTLEGGTGNDSLTGGDGSDTYLFSGSSDLGDDTIVETDADEDADVLDFSATNLGGLELYLDTMSQQTNVLGTNLSLTLSSDTGIEGVIGTSSDDGVVGNSRPNTIQGGNGADIIIGQGGDDSLLGGDGVDEIYGFDGDDIIDGGAENDFLDGGDEDVEDVNNDSQGSFQATGFP